MALPCPVRGRHFHVHSALGQQGVRPLERMTSPPESARERIVDENGFPVGRDSNLIIVNMRVANLQQEIEELREALGITSISITFWISPRSPTPNTTA